MSKNRNSSEEVVTGELQNATAEVVKLDTLPSVTEAPSTGSQNTRTAVVYHTPYAAPRKLYIKQKREDGTLDLVNDDGKVEVIKCPVAKVPTSGHATLQLGDLEIRNGDDRPGDVFPEIK